MEARPRLAVEREIRFRVTRGEPPTGGRAMVQAYVWRGRGTLRVRLVEGGEARMTLKAPRHEGRFEWEWPIPASLARTVLALPLPRVEKTRLRSGRLEVDRLSWPAPIVLCELELGADEGPDLRDADARRRVMEGHRPEWVEDWEDVTDDPRYTNARLARRRPRGGGDR